MKIFLSADDNYFIQLFVTISSILENTKRTNELEFLVFNKKIRKENQNKLISYVENKKSKIKFLKINPKKYSKLKLWGHVSEAGYYRLEIPKIESKEKVIYLDSDIIVLEDIFLLAKEDLGKFTIGAVEDYYLTYFKKINSFNSGVLIIDCDKWNKEKYTEKLISFIEKNGDKISLADQEILNSVFGKNYKKLPLRWNRQKRLFESSYREMNLSKDEYEKLIKNPSLIHFTGKIKPWHYKYIFPDKKIYVSYLKKIGYKESYPDKNLFNRIIYKPLRWIVYKTKLRMLIEK